MTFLDDRFLYVSFFLLLTGMVQEQTGQVEEKRAQYRYVQNGLWVPVYWSDANPLRRLTVQRLYEQLLGSESPQPPRNENISLGTQFRQPTSLISGIYTANVFLKPSK